MYLPFPYPLVADIALRHFVQMHAQALAHAHAAKYSCTRFFSTLWFGK
jgi:hypothetical protein